MDYGTVIERIIREYASIPYAYEPDVRQIPVFDREQERFLLMVAGWGAQGERVHYCLLHVEVREGLVWIEQDGTEEGVAVDLERAGVARDRIVLAFHRPEMRRHTGYAVA